MSSWYYALGDSEQGPIPAAELKALAVDGTIGPDTLVWKDGMPDWKRAAEVPGLLAANSPAPAAGTSRSRSSAGSRRPDNNPYDDSTDYGEPYEAPRRSSGRMRHPDGAGVVLALGIISLITCAPLGIAAWIMGNNYMSECRRMNIEPEGTAVAGRICGMIALGFMALGLLVIFPLVCIGAAAGP